MTKRRAIEALQPVSSFKKTHLEEFGNLSDIEDPEDDIISAQSPSSVAEAETPATAVTTPRHKFPSDLKTLVCTWPGCPKTFNRPARLRDHLNSHTNSRPFICPYDDCEKDYIEDKHLKQHIKAVHTHERKHVCQRDGCGKSFVTGTRLKRHQLVHEGADRHRCPDCGQSFRKRETLNKHVRKDHQGVSPYPCVEPSCGRAFETKPALKRHRELEHGELKYWCGECALKTLEDGLEHKEGFTTEAKLHAHMRREHQDCMFCDFKSSSKWELDTHIDMHHSGKSVEERKKEPCPYPNCGKRFTKKSNLNVHIRTAHDGVRFVCGQVDLTGPFFDGWSNSLGCGDKFSTKVRLEDHVRFIHLGHERQRLSKMDFASVPEDLIDELTGLTNHSKHTISCSHCDQLFIRYHDLNLHINSEHGDPSASSSVNDSTPFLTQIQSRDLLATASVTAPDEQPVFKEEYDQSSWPEEMAQDEIFAAEMDYGPQRDEWLDDEMNLLMLAREADSVDAQIDPALGVV